MVSDQQEDQAYHHGARRRSKRYRFNAGVHFVRPAPADGLMLNRSAGGARVVLSRDMPHDQECLFEVWITPRRYHIERARVVWSQEHVDGWILGLEFLEEHSPDDTPPQA